LLHPAPQPGSHRHRSGDTLSDEEKAIENARTTAAFGADAGSTPVSELTIQIWLI
jgi:hypothetical protein